jgi:hypothetical protein
LGKGRKRCVCLSCRPWSSCLLGCLTMCPRMYRFLCVHESFTSHAPTLERASSRSPARWHERVLTESAHRHSEHARSSNNRVRAKRTPHQTTRATARVKQATEEALYTRIDTNASAAYSKLRSPTGEDEPDLDCSALMSDRERTICGNTHQATLALRGHHDRRRQRAPQGNTPVLEHRHGQASLASHNVATADQDEMSAQQNRDNTTLVLVERALGNRNQCTARIENGNIAPHNVVRLKDGLVLGHEPPRIAQLLTRLVENLGAARRGIESVDAECVINVCDIPKIDAANIVVGR